MSFCMHECANQTSSVNLLPLLPSKLDIVAGVTLLWAPCGFIGVMRGAFCPASGVNLYPWMGKVGLVGDVFSDNALVGLMA